MPQPLPAVLLVTHYFPAHGGGIELVAGNVARRLGESGHAIEWFASATDPAPEFRRVTCRPQPALNWTERALGIPLPIWSLAAYFRLLRAVDRSDVVHLHDGIYPANFVAALWALWKRKRLVVTQHVGFVPYRHPALRALLATANRIVGHCVLKHADATLFVSHTVRSYFEEIVGTQAGFAELPNGVDSAHFSPAAPERREALRLALGIPAGQPMLLFVGRHVEKKGLGLVRVLAARTPGWCWCLVGAGPIDPSSWGLDNVRVKGRLPQAEIVDCYRAADVLVLPSVGEGFPLVVQEALSCGLPVAVHTETRDAGGLPPTVCVADSVVGDDAPARWHRMLEAMLLDDRITRQARSEACRRFATAKWSWDATVREYASVLSGR